jgi:hypothetical protein
VYLSLSTESCCAGPVLHAHTGAVTSFITAPTELLKIRMQLQTSLPGAPGYLGPLAMLRRVVLQEGYRCGEDWLAPGNRAQARRRRERSSLLLAPHTS